MGIERLKELIMKYRQSIRYYHDSKNAYNETECRDEYISPLLECFGWDVHNKKGKLPQYRDVVVERFSSSFEKPDYTLTLNGVSKIFVEAKKPSIDIMTESEPARQTRRYGWNARHAISILTNFEDLIIYDTTNQPNENDDVKTSLFRKYHFDEYIDKYQEIHDLISRESIYSGKYDEFVNVNFRDMEKCSTEIDETFLKQINKWRLDLGNYLFQKNAKYRNIKLLNDTVQDFINQIIFLRICEDRKLPVYKRLYDMISDKKELQVTLTSIFKKVDKRYNSGLFKGKNVVFDLNSEIIFDMIQSLYYPKKPYLFTIIEPSILGKIYEAFLTESLKIEDNNVGLAKKKEYKFKSIVSTPIEIVKYMVKNTLYPVCSGKNPNEILKLKVIDISCGSGIFLEEAFQFLVEYCVGWYENNEPDHLMEMSNGKKKLPIEEKKQILVNCIYGVDIDVHAVEISKFSLLLKLVEDETEPSVKTENPILPDLSYNIKAGNSLISDSDVKNIRLTTEQLIEIMPFEWSKINNNEKFDVVLGNPPYVKTEDMHLLLIDEEFDIYKKKFQCAYKQFDKYFLFVEKALDIIKENGVISYIIPNKFYKIAAGQELRRLICKNVVSIDDFGDAQLFPDKTIYSAIVTIGKKRNFNMRYSHVSSIAELWTGEVNQSVEISNERLNQNPWCLSSDIEILKLLYKIQLKAVPLSHVAEIFNGIQTSAERPEKFSNKKEVYWFDNSVVESEDNDYVYVEKFGKVYKLEKALLKPYFKPTKLTEKGMNTYSLLKTEKRIIFPYDNEGKLISIDIMQTCYKETFKYLKDCYDRLVPRCLNNGIGRDIPDATPDTWYQYGRTQALRAFVNHPKLIVRILSKEPMYAYDNQDMLIASGGTAGYCAVGCLPNSEYQLEYIQAWLAHPYTEKIFKILGSDFENGFTSRGTFILKKIPFILLDFNDENQYRLYEEVVSSTKRVYQLNYEMLQYPEKAARSVLENEKNKLINRIEELIAKVYQQDF